MPLSPPPARPVTDLPTGETNRQAHQMILAGHGSEGQRRLAAGRVLVVGADEIGAPLIAHLADAGVGTIGVADGPPMEPWDRYLGLPDAEPADRAAAWARALGRSHPIVRTVAESWFELPRARGPVRDYDLVVCAGEDPVRCQLVDDVCAEAGIPFVWGSTEVVKLLTGQGEPLVGRVMEYDGMAGTCATVPLRPHMCAARPAEPTAAEPFFGLLSPAATEAARESTISVEQLKELLDADAPVNLVDVREPDEYAFAHLAGSMLVPQGEFLHGDAATRLPTDRKTVLLCRAGIRSAEVLAVVKRTGHHDAVHLGGGILSWAGRIDPGMPTY
ncbi:ThiF family adenylyltransferase [Streptomyces sp. cmx-4-7]|uniref:ThiF family adenylyltransferase n=2 Tax=unclassified Streptomyces TaxID=2593676 RepID=UPI00397F8573